MIIPNMEKCFKPPSRLDIFLHFTICHYLSPSELHCNQQHVTIYCYLSPFIIYHYYVINTYHYLSLSIQKITELYIYREREFNTINNKCKYIQLNIYIYHLSLHHSFFFHFAGDAKSSFPAAPRCKEGMSSCRRATEARMP